MNIRPAMPEDAEALAKVHIDSWRSAYRGFVPEAFLAGLDYGRREDQFRSSIASNAREIHVAEEDGTIQGFLSLGVCEDADVDHESTGEIRAIYLAPEFWRKGTGRFLCEWAETQLASRGYSTIILWAFKDNGRGRKFYDAMGFRPDGATRMLNRGKELEVIRYRKEL